MRNLSERRRIIKQRIILRPCCTHPPRSQPIFDPVGCSDCRVFKFHCRVFKFPALLILPLAAMEKVRDILSEARGATSELYGAFY